MTSMVRDNRQETAIRSTNSMKKDDFSSTLSPSTSSTLQPQQTLHQRSFSIDESEAISKSPVGNMSPSTSNGRLSPSPDATRQWVMEQWQLPLAIAAWYLVGVISIVTTKVLLTDWQIPPLVITFQQLLTGSCVLWCYLLVSQGGAQPWPWDASSSSSSKKSIDLGTAAVPEKAMLHYDFVLAGLFNALDFLASNTAFSQSAASFVETIKASEPITTTAVALAWKVDRLGKSESASLALLIAGVLLSTWANAESKVVPAIDTASSSHVAATATAFEEQEEQALQDSFRISATVMTANLCFAFRAMSQKFYRRNATRHAVSQLDNVNLLCRMQQMGALSLLLPLLVFDGAACLEFLLSDSNTWDLRLRYLGLALLNAVSFAIYNLASTFVLSKLPVLNHSGLNSLRRMFCTMATCVFFGVPMTLQGGFGILMSFTGFFAFTHYRNLRQTNKTVKAKDSHV